MAPILTILYQTLSLLSPLIMAAGNMLLGTLPQTHTTHTAYLHCTYTLHSMTHIWIPFCGWVHSCTPPSSFLLGDRPWLWMDSLPHHRCLPCLPSLPPRPFRTAAACHALPRAAYLPPMPCNMPKSGDRLPFATTKEVEVSTACTWAPSLLHYCLLPMPHFLHLLRNTIHSATGYLP